MSTTPRYQRLNPAERRDQILDAAAIPPSAQRQFAQRMGAATIARPSSHLAMVSHPDEVTELNEMAAAISCETSVPISVQSC